MNTKFSFTLLIIMIAMLAAACSPAIVESSAPLVQSVQPASNEKSKAVMPVTGKSASTFPGDIQESRRWSGEVFLSDNNSPDHLQNAKPAIDEAPLDGCMLYDSQPRRQSGCAE